MLNDSSGKRSAVLHDTRFPGGPSNTCTYIPNLASAGQGKTKMPERTRGSEAEPQARYALPNSVTGSVGLHIVWVGTVGGLDPI